HVNARDVERFQLGHGLDGGIRGVFDGAGDGITCALAERLPNSQVLQQPEVVEDLIGWVGLNVVFPSRRNELTPIGDCHCESSHPTTRTYADCWAANRSICLAKSSAFRSTGALPSPPDSVGDTCPCDVLAFLL